MTFSPANALQAYLPTYKNFYVDDEQLRVVLTATYISMAYATNIKEIGQYEEVEVLDGQQWFDPADAQKKRFGFRKVYSFAAIAPGATLLIPHGIFGQTIFTMIRGTCITSVVDYRPIPYASTVALAQQISIRVIGANIEIINGAGSPAITGGVAILEYLKN